MRALLASALVLGSLSAQLPRDEVLIVEQPQVRVTTSNFRVVGPENPRLPVGYLQRPTIFVPLGSVAIDAQHPERIYITNRGGTLPGIWQAVMRGPRMQRAVRRFTSAQLVRQVATDASTLYYTSRDGLWAQARSGGRPTRVLALPQAEAIEVVGSLVYVASKTTSSVLWEYDSRSKRSRKIGSTLPPFRSMTTLDARRFVAAGTGGELLTIDRFTGRVLARKKLSSGALLSVAVTSRGLIFAADRLRVWSSLQANPIYRTARPIVDLAISRRVSSAWRTFGSPCKSSAGNLAFAYENTPKLGQAFALRVNGGVANGVALLNLGASRTRSVAFGSLPLALDAAGLNGCKLYVDFGAFGVARLDNTGAGRLNLPIPNVTALRGLQLFFQWWAVDPRANRAGLVTSNGLLATPN